MHNPNFLSYFDLLKDYRIKEITSVKNIQNTFKMIEKVKPKT